MIYFMIFFFFFASFAVEMRVDFYDLMIKKRVLYLGNRHVVLINIWMKYNNKQEVCITGPGTLREWMDILRAHIQ